jgi:hypothetical protein
MFLPYQYWAVKDTELAKPSRRVMVSLSLLHSVHSLPLTVTAFMGAAVVLKLFTTLWSPLNTAAFLSIQSF